MVFHSFLFVLLFLTPLMLIHWLVCMRGQVVDRKRLLLAAALFFYALASLQSLPILLGSLFMNQFMARRIQGTAGTPRRRWLTIGIVLNVALLMSFKYTHFLVDSVTAPWGWRPDIPVFLLPLGISFFTIQQIIYLVDCYEDMMPRVPLLEHAIFISFFAYIAAGPITHARDFLPQLESHGPPPESRMTAGLLIFITGLAKKVILADTFAPIADSGFNSAVALGMVEGWLAALAYMFQLYFDFSGYSDMAIGAALMLGLVLPENFNSPLKAHSLIDFWKRWHMTLTGFITTYLYTPLARRTQRLTFAKAMLITLLVMTISGFWHGAAWTFLLWGLLHGLGLVVNHLWRKTKVKLSWPVAWLFTFAFVTACGVVFRAESLPAAMSIFSSMAGVHGNGFHAVFHAGAPQVLIILAGAAIALCAPNTRQLSRYFTPSWRSSLAGAGVLMLCLLFMSTGSTTANIYRGF